VKATGGGHVDTSGRCRRGYVGESRFEEALPVRCEMHSQEDRPGPAVCSQFTNGQARDVEMDTSESRVNRRPSLPPRVSACTLASGGCCCAAVRAGKPYRTVASQPQNRPYRRVGETVLFQPATRVTREREREGAPTRLPLSKIIGGKQLQESGIYPPQHCCPHSNNKQHFHLHPSDPLGTWLQRWRSSRPFALNDISRR